MTMIKALHFADTHLGVELYGRLDPNTGLNTRVVDFLDRMDEIVDYVEANDVDLVIFAGDAFHKRTPTPTLLREFAVRIKRLADLVPVVLVPGNHDMPGSSSLAHTIEIFGVLGDDNIIVGNRPGSQNIETKSGPVFVAWIPYPMKNRLMKNNEDATADELEIQMRNAVRKILQKLSDTAEQFDMPRILVGHFSVDGATLGSEQNIMLGADIAVSKEALNAGEWDYVALGHIHKHQELNDGEYPPIVYSGSIERIDFGEEGQPKGICLIDLERGDTSWEFVPLDARDFVTVEIDVINDNDPMQAILDALEGIDNFEPIVRVKIRMRREQDALIRDHEIRSSLSSASYVIIAKDIEATERMRLDVAHETLSELELLKRYFEANGTDPQKEQRLLDKAKEIIDDTA